MGQFDPIECNLSYLGQIEPNPIKFDMIHP